MLHAKEWYDALVSVEKFRAPIVNPAWGWISTGFVMVLPILFFSRLYAMDYRLSGNTGAFGALAAAFPVVGFGLFLVGIVVFRRSWLFIRRAKQVVLADSGTPARAMISPDLDTGLVAVSLRYDDGTSEELTARALPDSDLELFSMPDTSVTVFGSRQDHCMGPMVVQTDRGTLLENPDHKLWFNLENSSVVMKRPWRSLAVAHALLLGLLLALLVWLTQVVPAGIRNLWEFWLFWGSFSVVYPILSVLAFRREQEMEKAVSVNCSVLVRRSRRSLGEFLGGVCIANVIEAGEAECREYVMLPSAPSSFCKAYEAKLFRNAAGKILKIDAGKLSLFPRRRVFLLPLIPIFSLMVCHSGLVFRVLGLEHTDAMMANLCMQAFDNKAEGYYYAGVHYGGRGNFSEARRYLRKAQVMEPNSSAAAMATAYIDRSMPPPTVSADAERLCTEATKATSDGRELSCLKECIDRYPDIAWPYTHLAKIYVRTKAELAIPLLERALTISPRCPEALNTMVRAQLIVGNHNLAKRYLDQVIAAEGDNEAKLVRWCLDWSI